MVIPLFTERNLIQGVKLVNNLYDNFTLPLRVEA